MCGIALIVSGIRLDLSSLHVDARPLSPSSVHEQVSVLHFVIFVSFAYSLDLLLWREFQLSA